MPSRCVARRFRARAAAALLVAVALSVGMPAHGEELLLEDGFELGLCAWSFASPWSETFAGSDGAPWPDPWTAAGNVAQADLAAGRGRLRPSPSAYSLGRMKAPVDTRDVEVTFTLTFEEQSTQGVGLYVRQNGGYLQQTTTHGQGYAVFVEGFRGFPRIGLWKEQDGVEIELDFTNLVTPFADGVPYRVRYRVEQVDAASTHLHGKVWPAAALEPAGWDVDVVDATPILQQARGGVAVDSWSSRVAPDTITAHTLVDDLVVTAVCGP